MSTKRIHMLEAALLLAAAMLLPLALNSYYMHILILVLFYAFGGVSWNFLGGYCGQFYFAHCVFIGIGAYTSTLLFNNLGLSPWIGMLAGGVLTILVALGIGAVTFRAGLRDTYFALGSLALVEITRALALNARWAGGAQGLFITVNDPGLLTMQFKTKLPYYYIILAFLVLGILLTQKIAGSKLGYYFMAIRENEEAAQAVGVPMVRYKLIAISTSAFIGAMAGTFFAQYITFFDPTTLFTFEMAVQIVIVAIVGGSGSVAGPILGSILLVPLSEFVRGKLGQNIAGVHLIVYGLILMLTILYLPDGINGLIHRVLEHISRKYPKMAAALGIVGEPTQLPSCAEVDIRKSAGDQPEEMLRVENLSKHFGGLKAVDGVSFTVNRGEILGIMGPNGAGKTTIFALITGFLKPTTGTVTYCGKDITGMGPHQVCHLGLTRTFQVVQPFPGLNTLETATIAAYQTTSNKEEARARAIAVLRQVGLESRALQPTKTLNLPDLKRLEVAKALCTGADLILLDEVMAGLTDVEVKEMVEMVHDLRDEGFTFVIIEHVMSAMMNLADRLLVLDFGKLIGEGEPSEIIRDPRVISAYLGGEDDAETA